MTKDIKQIQEENRKLILEAIHGCSYDKLDIFEHDLIFPHLPLSRVLLALGDKQIVGEFKQNIFCFSFGPDYDDAILWDLTKETLEEQSQETQIKINELLKGE